MFNMAGAPSRLAFNCYKQALVALNVMYLVVGLVLVSVPVYSKLSSVFTSWPIVGGTITCGVFILLVSLAGLYGTCRHHQITLFFYMLVLVLIFIILFSMSIAALSISSTQEETLLTQGWTKLGKKTRAEVQEWGNCCGFKNINATGDLDHPPCVNLKCYNKHCPTCFGYLKTHGLEDLKKAIGGVGLFFSLTLFIGVYLAFKFRHIKDPRANPGAFL